MTTTDFFLRLALAALAGGVVGVERGLRGHVAGVRTHSLVAVGAALFALAGVSGTAGVPSADPTRMAAQVVSGIGFIGAGAILRDGGGVRGLTTAATIWVSGALGVGAAVGDVYVSIFGIGLVLVILLSKRPLRWLFRSKIEMVDVGIDITYQLGHGTIGPLVRIVEETDSEIVGFTMDDDAGSDEALRLAQIRLRTPELELPVLARTVEKLDQRDEVRSVMFDSKLNGSH